MILGKGEHYLKGPLAHALIEPSIMLRFIDGQDVERVIRVDNFEIKISFGVEKTVHRLCDMEIICD